MFISHAQNFEDIILWRALRHIERGFYIDIGAQEPVTDSVSLGFYEQGWRGAHVEATVHYADKLRAARPDEEVLQVAVSDTVGDLTFFEIADTGLSTGNAEFAEKHRATGHGVTSTTVPAVPLAEVLERYGQREIHWLKIDVEGMEARVIRGWGASAVRPWIVVVESTEPCTTIPTYDEWEPRLVALGYDFVYFDGVNRFYVSHAHPELKQHFGLPFNIFDLETGIRLSAGVAFCATAEGRPVIVEPVAVDTRYERLLETLRLDEGPRALRMVLPLARAIRRLYRLAG